MISEEGRIEGTPTVVLRTEDQRGRVEIAADLGGACTRLVLGGRSWLHRNVLMSLEQRRAAARLAPATERYVRFADIGLGDFCLGSVSGDRVDVDGHGRVEIQDHGWAWSADDVRVEPARRDGDACTSTRWRIDADPFAVELSRETMLVSAEELSQRFRITARGTVGVPAFWSTHDMFELTDDTRYVLPTGTPMVVFHSEGDLLLRKDLRHRWPLFTTMAGDQIDLSRPGALVSRFAAKVFSAEHAGPVALEQGGMRLTLDARATHVALWTNNRGWAPPGVPAGSYRNLCMERSSASSDRVSDVSPKVLLTPGEVLELEVTYRAGSSREGRRDG